MSEYAELYYQEMPDMGDGNLPCHVNRYEITFYDNDYEHDLEGPPYIIKSPEELMKHIKKSELPLVLICITDDETKYSKLARAIKRMTCSWKVSAVNPRDGHGGFTDLFFKVRRR